MKTSHTAFIRRAIAIALLTTVMIGSSPAQQSFQITSLTATSSNVVEHEPVTGDDRGGIALSSTSLFYTGDNATGSFPTSDISNGSMLGYQYDVLASNIKTKQVYALGTQFGIVQDGGDLVTRLVPLDPTTGVQLGGEITLSTPISLSSLNYKAGIFSGWDRIVLLDGDSLNAFNIDLPSGNVTALGTLNLYSDSISSDDRLGCENWATWGIAEYAGGSIKLVYSSSTNFGGNSAIKRYDVGNDTVTTVADFPAGVSDLCSFTVDPATNRWYFHYESYAGAFNFGNDENIGYATASFLTPSSSVAKISGRVLIGKGRGIAGVSVTAVGSDGSVARVVTNTFGTYVLPKLKVGQTYVVSVESRRHYFPVSSELVVLNDDLVGLDFEAY